MIKINKNINVLKLKVKTKFETKILECVEKSMDYMFTFLEGIASFISPCLLPMLPIYVSYFIGKENKSSKKTLINAVSFVLGFTVVFLLLSIFASQFGFLISSNTIYIKVIFGIVVIILGLNYMDILKLNIFNNHSSRTVDTSNLNFVKSFLFGTLFSISWTPCIGVFLSSALLLIAKQQDMLKGIVLMLLYSIGLGIPFIISALLIEQLKGTFNYIKKNYSVIKKISGIILILMGIYIIFF